MKNIFKKKKSENEKPKKKKKILSKIGYWLLVFIVFIGLLVFIAGVGFCYYIVTSAPEFNIEKMFEKEATKIYSSEGTLIATLGTEQRQKVTYDELPQVLIDAIIATEDSRFFQHNGFDAPRFLKASISQVLNGSGGGASTLTMQLSKLAFTSVEDEGFAGIVRKFTDIYMSVFKIEKNLTKEEIIEYYVNTPCMGGNIYGVKQASQYYFGKDVSDLNLVEAAQIAGMFQSPNGYNPYVNPNDANERKNTVLYLMKRHGYITETEYEAAKSVEIKDFLAEGVSSTNEYQGFIDTVVAEVIRDTGNNPYDVPMDIYTTMVTKKQDAINNFYKTYKFKDKYVEVGIGVIDVKTGAIVAVGAGRNKKTALSLNVATFDNQTYKRMPGSTIKPILDYGPAMEYAGLSTYGPFIDDETPYGGGSMRNFSGSYKGFMTMRDCLKNSINTCALQAFRMTTNEEKMKFANGLGITFSESTIPDSYAIGAFNGVSPVQLAAAYAAFANGGTYHTYHSYTKLVYRETEEEVEKTVTATKVMKPQTAYMIRTVLTSATSSSVKVSGTQIATKTGTTSYDTSVLKSYGLTSSVIPDSWTSSFTADYAMAIWYGYTTGLTKDTVKKKQYLLNGEASTTRIKIQANLASKIYEKNSKFSNPGGVSSVKVELETIPAAKPSAYTPSNLQGTFLFTSGTEPTETSNRFSKLTDPSNITYSQTGNLINVSWTSPGIPDAINTSSLTEYFNTGYTIWAEKYLNKRLSYNKSKIGNFGFDIYLTSGTSSTYVGWTDAETYTINLNSYTGTYDGVIVKSSYSKFKSNASDGVKILLENASNGNSSEEENKTTEEKISESDINVSLTGLTVVYKTGETYTPLTSSLVSISYNGTNIKSDVTALTLTNTEILNSNNEKISESDITKEIGNYKATYTVSFKYKDLSITKTFTQNIAVQ